MTGAASGIGAGIAEGFAREGADLVLVDQVDEESAAAVLTAVGRHGGAGQLRIGPTSRTRTRVRSMVHRPSRSTAGSTCW